MNKKPRTRINFRDLVTFLKENTWKTNLFMAITLFSLYWVWGAVVWVLMEVILAPYKSVIKYYIYDLPAESSIPYLQGLTSVIFVVIVVFGTLLPLVYVYTKFTGWFIEYFDLNNDRKYSLVPRLEMSVPLTDMTMYNSNYKAEESLISGNIVQLPKEDAEDV